MTCIHEYEPYDEDSPDCPDCRHDAGLVGCDEKGCTAKEKPETFEEVKVALAHWRGHRYLHGCSHACC